MSVLIFLQIIKSVQMNTQSDANTRKNKRITITFLLICISWAILTLPHRVFSIFQEVILTAILPNDKTAGGMGFVQRRLYHSLAEGATWLSIHPIVVQTASFCWSCLKSFANRSNAAINSLVRLSWLYNQGVCVRIYREALTKKVKRL